MRRTVLPLLAAGAPVTGGWTQMMGWLRSWLAATGFADPAL